MRRPKALPGGGVMGEGTSPGSTGVCTRCVGSGFGMADSSAEQCIAIIHDLERMLADARGSFRDQQTCMINREAFRNKLRVLSSSLPGAVRTATEYVTSINAIRQQAEQDCTTQRRDAEQRAEQLMNDARQNADHTRAEADQQLAHTALQR